MQVCRKVYQRQEANLRERKSSTQKHLTVCFPLINPERVGVIDAFFLFNRDAKIEKTNRNVLFI